MSTQTDVGEIFQKKRESTGTSYEEVPYISYPFAQSHPRRMATVARLMGMRTADLKTCRVLELACSGGGNLIPMAEQLPQGHFVGVDAAAIAIKEGKETIEALGLTNIELHHMDIMDVGEEFGEFDYIIAHGVFSWVPEKVRLKILEICSRLLAPQGVAYISYNTNPGWRLRGTIRDVMRYRAQFFSTPEEKLGHARALLGFLAKSVPVQGNPFGQLLNNELQNIQKSADYYLLHEFLEDENQPMYFHEFVELANQKGLQYVGEAEFNSMSVNNFGPEVSQMLKSISSDVVQIEQYMDFVRNRLFRQTLICRSDVKLTREASAAVVEDLYISSRAKPEVPVTDLLANQEVRFRAGHCSMKSASPLIKAVMLVLEANWPQPIRFDELMRQVRARLSAAHWKSDVSEEEDDKAIKGMLVHAYSTTVADLTVHAWPICVLPDEKPLASPLARLQAKRSSHVTSLAHSNTALTGFQSYVLSLLDGTQDRGMLLEHLYQQSKDELRLVDATGQPISDKEQILKVVGNVLDEALKHLAGCLLLVR